MENKPQTNTVPNQMLKDEYLKTPEYKNKNYKKEAKSLEKNKIKLLIVLLRFTVII